MDVVQVDGAGLNIVDKSFDAHGHGAHLCPCVKSDHRLV
jgi:hypothetical protein